MMESNQALLNTVSDHLKEKDRRWATIVAENSHLKKRAAEYLEVANRRADRIIRMEAEGKEKDDKIDSLEEELDHLKKLAYYRAPGSEDGPPITWADMARKERERGDNMARRVEELRDKEFTEKAAEAGVATTVPQWTYDTFPKRCEWVRRCGNQFRVVGFGKTGIWIAHAWQNGVYDWDKVHEEFEAWSYDGLVWFTIPGAKNP